MLNIEPFKQVKKNTRASLPEYNTSWRPPREFPNLSAAKKIALDTETYDPDLLTAGPGYARGVGHIIGVSLSVDAQNSWYFPVRHEIQPELNLNPDNVFAWLKDTLSTSIPKVGANLQYDVGWLQTEDIFVKGKLYDVQSAEALIDPDAYSYALEKLGQKYLSEGKVSNELYEWLSRAYGGKADGKQRANMYRSPISLAGPYAESDAYLPLQILQKQWKMMDILQLHDVYDLETRLIPVLIAMKFRGARVSSEQALIAKEQLSKHIISLEDDVNQVLQRKTNVNSPVDLEELFQTLNIPIQYTEKKNPSFQKQWLESQIHPIADKIITIRKYKKTISTFLEGAIIEKSINGKIFTSFNQLKTDSGGALTGRFSSSNPNLQNIPNRDPVIGKLMRKMFIPEDGYTGWMKMDYSSVEFRIFAHFVYTVLFNDVLWKAYQDDPLTDFHGTVQILVGGGLPRVAYKTISFSRMYGGGIKTITKQMALAFKEDQQREIITQLGHRVLSNPAEQLARLIMNLYDNKFPVVSDALEAAGDIAQNTGEMRTILNRRTTFSKWEPIRGKCAYPLSYDEAVLRFGANNIRRRQTYKALNYYNQGTAADIMKKAMVDAYEAGLFAEDKLKAPHLTVHDELDFSHHPDLDPYFKELKLMMENTIKLSVPLIVDAEVGPSWGEVTEYAL